MKTTLLRISFGLPAGLLAVFGLLATPATTARATDAPPPPTKHLLRLPLSRANDQFKLHKADASVGGGTESAGVATSSGGAPAPFLTRPYMNWHGVNSVFDHCLSTGYYSPDGRICEVDGTVAVKSNGIDPYFSEGYAVTPGGTDYLYYDGHDGWDIALDYETVLAAAGGTIVYAGWDNGGWGYTILINHGNGFETRYAHLSEVDVSVNQTVGRGQRIGISGSTGNSTGPHLHFGLYRTDMTVFGGEMTAIDPWGWQGSGTDPWPYDEGDLWITGNPTNPVPDAPVNVSATPGAASATVTWSPPAFTGAGVSTYTVTASSGASESVSGSTTKAVMTNLTPGKSYTFTVAAADSLGSSAASAASNAVTPIAAANGYWEYLGGIATSAPAITSAGVGTLDVFVRGTDGQAWTMHWDGSQWSQWQGLGGQLLGAPAVVSYSPGRIDLFVRGTDNQLWHKFTTGGAWTAWEALGGSLTSAPAVTSPAQGQLDVFARGTDNQLWHRYYKNGWSQWQPLGGALVSGPGASSGTGGWEDVFVEGTDQQMWHKILNQGSSWSGWQPMGGVLTGAPAAVEPSPGILDVYVVGTSSQLYVQRWNGSAWSGYTSLGGSWTSDPAAASQPGSGTVDVVAAGSDQAVYHSNLGPG